MSNKFVNFLETIKYMGRMTKRTWIIATNTSYPNFPILKPCSKCKCMQRLGVVRGVCVDDLFYFEQKK